MTTTVTELACLSYGVQSNVVTVYLDVWQNREIVTLRKKYVSNLKNQLRATKSRFDAGELTRTDVEQAKASLAQSQSALADARSDYQSSLAKYEQLVGHAAGNIILPKVPSVPGSLDSAHLKVIQRHPNVLAANSAVNAAGSSIEIAKGDLLPEIDLSATASATADPAVDIERSTSIQIQLSGKIALYDGGKTNSSVRQAVQTKSQRLLEVVETTRDVRKSVSEAWASHMSARQRIVSKVSEVSAARLALQGVQQEYQVGSRSTTDVLDAEQSLLEARIEQISARRDVVQAAYGLIFAMGELDKRHF
jgi:outer membrane protein